MITWQTSGSVHPGRFTVDVPNYPPAAWATGMLSENYEHIFSFMEMAKVHAKEAVRARSRVDTGLMRHMVESSLAVRGDVFELNFGWSEGAPFYAPFQEFGTRNGIEPMLAVHDTFHEILPHLRAALVMQ